MVFVEMAKAEKDITHPGHLDAVAFLNHDKRCKAVALSTPVNYEYVQKLIKEHSIPEESLCWEVNTFEDEFQMSLDFPVLRKDQSIIFCRELSKITVPTATSNWLYLPADYEKLLRQGLGST